MTAVVEKPRIKFGRIIARLTSMCFTLMMLTVSVCATGGGGSDTGTTSSAISDVGSALTGILGYISGVTATILGDDLWIMGMGFFVVSFICGLVMYFFRVGRR